MNYPAKEIDIVCIGDSITRRDNPDIITYPSILQDNLIKKGYCFYIANNGKEGDLAENASTRVSEALGTYKNAKYFIIELGINDIARISPLESMENTSIKIIKNLEAAIQEVLNARKTPIMLNLSPVNQGLINIISLSPKNIEYHNNQLAQMCMDKKVHLIDIYNELGEELFLDGIHPNKKGSEIIANSLFDILECLIKQSYEKSRFLKA